MFIMLLIVAGSAVTCEKFKPHLLFVKIFFIASTIACFVFTKMLRNLECDELTKKYCINVNHTQRLNQHSNWIKIIATAKLILIHKMERYCTKLIWSVK